MANVLGREPSVGRCVVSCSRRTMMRMRLSITRGCRAIERIKSVAADAQKFGVAERHELCRMRFAGNQRHLAHGLARLHMGDEAPGAVVVFHEHAKAARNDKEQRVIVLAVAFEKRAAGQAEPVGLRQKALEGRFADIVQQRKIAQTRAKQVRVNGLPTDAKGRQKCHVHRMPASL